MKKFLKSPLLTLLLFIVASVLLVVGGIGTTQAAFSDEYDYWYRAEMQLKNIGVSLLQGYTPDVATAEPISCRRYGSQRTGIWAEQTQGVLIKGMVKNAKDDELKIGKEYPVYLSAQNTGQVDEYVRLTLYKYWVTENGKKIAYDSNTQGWFDGTGASKAVLENGQYRVKYDPSLIEISYDESGFWKLDQEASTDERLVFYHSEPLPKATDETGSNGGKTLPVVTGVRINPGVLGFKEKDENGVYKYAYDGVGFVIEAQVDAVQASHSEHSIPSAWGVTR